MSPRPALGLTALEAREHPAAPFQSLSLFTGGDPAVLDVARATAVRGALLGRQPDAFLKGGDSISAPGLGSGYLFPFGDAAYDPVATGLAAAFPELLDTVAAFRAPAGVTGTNSFARNAATAQYGFRAADVLGWLPFESAATRAAVGVVMIGTNDATIGTPLPEFRATLEQIVRWMLSEGVVPVLSTVPDNLAFEGTVTGRVPAYNQLIADVAEQYRVPLLNAWAALATLPGRGLAPDQLHLNASSRAGGVTPGDLAYGENVRNVLSLQALDWFREQVLSGPPEVPALPAWSPLATGEAAFSAGRDAGQAAVVSVFDAAGNVRNQFLAFEPSFVGGVRVATADVTGDGIPDVVAGAGPGGGPAVKVFSGADGSLVATFFAFEPSFRSGVTVAAADLDGDGVSEVVAGAGDGGGPAVAVFHGSDFRELSRFFAYEPTFRGGVNVAAGVVSGVGRAVVVGAGGGGGPVVKVFRLCEPEPVFSYLAYDPGVRSGLAVAVGPFGLVATAPAVGAPHVRLMDAASGAEGASFFAPVAGEPGLRLGTLRDGTGSDRLLIGGGATPGVQTWAFDGNSLRPLGLSDPPRAYGVYVG